MKLLPVFLLPLTFLAAPAAELFDGKTLAGWSEHAADTDRGTNYWKAVDGCIACDSRANPPKKAVWLQSDREYGDFELELEVKTDGTLSGNSGVQVRSRWDEKAQRVDGPQVDIHPPDPWRVGLIYDETPGHNRWIQPSLKNWDIAPQPVPAGWTWNAEGWNTLKIRCEGTRITTWVNGVQRADLDGRGVLDDNHHTQRNVGARGHIFLQLHGGAKADLRFRNLRVTETGSRR